MGKKRSPSDAVLMPNHCVVLAIDPGKHAGMAVLYGAHLLVSAQVIDNPKARDRAIAVAHDCQHKLITELKEDLPVVLVVERFSPGAGSHFSARTRDGLVQRVGAWIETWKRSGGSPKRIVRVYPTQWRSAVLGRGGGTSELLKTMARLYVEERYQLVIEDENEAEAICIGTWGVTAREVADTIGGRGEVRAPVTPENPEGGGPDDAPSEG